MVNPFCLQIRLGVVVVIISCMLWPGAFSVTLLPLHPSCTNGFLSMKMNRELVELKNMTVQVFGLDPDTKEAYRDASAQCRFLDMTERVAPGSVCLETSNEYIPDIDELHVQSFFNSTEARCEYYETEGEIEPGVRGKTLGINVTRLDLPQSFIRFKFMNPYNDYTYYSNDTSFTFNATYSRVYVKNRLKITVEQKNFNWTVPLDPFDSHYLKLYVECTFDVKEDFSMTIRQNLIEKWTTLNSGDVEMNIRFEQGFEIDQFPYIPRTYPSVYQFSGAGPATFGLYGTRTFCWNSYALTNYSSVTWDPSTQVLFNPSRKDNKWLVPVVVSLSVVLVLVLTVVALMLFVPSFRHWVRPYSARSEKGSSFQGLSTHNSTTTPSWTSGSKPNNQL